MSGCVGPVHVVIELVGSITCSCFLLKGSKCRVRCKEMKESGATEYLFIYVFCSAVAVFKLA